MAALSFVFTFWGVNYNCEDKAFTSIVFSLGSMLKIRPYLYSFEMIFHVISALVLLISVVLIFKTKKLLLIASVCTVIAEFIDVLTIALASVIGREEWYFSTFAFLLISVLMFLSVRFNKHFKILIWTGLISAFIYLFLALRIDLVYDSAINVTVITYHISAFLTYSFLGKYLQMNSVTCSSL